MSSTTVSITNNTITVDQTHNVYIVEGAGFSLVCDIIDGGVDGQVITLTTEPDVFANHWLRNRNFNGGVGVTAGANIAMTGPTGVGRYLQSDVVPLVTLINIDGVWYEQGYAENGVLA